MDKNIKSILLGKVLTSDQLSHEKLSRIWGLPIMASDAVSSVAYAIEEILMALVPAIGLLAINYVGLVSLPIIMLLLILVFSYSQIIKNYPNGGGAYVVSMENFGRRPALLAAACLLIDYIMTVAVSISSSTAAITAAFPVFSSYKIIISILCVFLITLINLRGASESSKIFGIPTYAFIVSMAIMIITGIIRVITGSLHPVSYSPQELSSLIPLDILPSITILLFLRAFASGCSALTGVEAVSNAVPSFKEPSQKTANHILFMLGGIIVFIFGGTSFLASVLKIIPIPEKTVMSQIASSVFGSGFMFYLLQVTTSLILLLAANTAYNGLPILLAILAKDGYMPRQFSQRGAKLSFSNGIIFILIVASILLIVFKANTHALIPFYSVGVFVSFTLSQSGMLIKWIKSKEKGWRHKSLINGFGALVTFVGTIVVFVTKFSQGAWALAIAIPLIMLFMAKSHKHYTAFAKQISAEGYSYVYTESTSNNKTPCVVLVRNISKAMLKTLDYTKNISSNIIVLHISTTPSHTERLQKQWEQMKIGMPLTIIEAPYRDVLTPLETYITEYEKKLKKGEHLTVILTKFIGESWRDIIFHNQTTYHMERKLRKHRDVITVLVPYVYNSHEPKECQGES